MDMNIVKFNLMRAHAFSKWECIFCWAIKKNEIFLSLTSVRHMGNIKGYTDIYVYKINVF